MTIPEACTCCSSIVAELRAVAERIEARGEPKLDAMLLRLRSARERQAEAVQTLIKAAQGERDNGDH